MLFFVLSGFLITNVLLQDRVTSGEVNLRAFYLRRVLRLAPALAVFLAVTVALRRLRLITDVPAYELAACVLYLRNVFGRSISLGHLWSLSLEEQFYLIWPWFVRLMDLRRLLTLAFVAILSITIARTMAIWLGWFNYNLGIVYMRPWFRFDSILFGCCLSLMVATDIPFLRTFLAVLRFVPAIAFWAILVIWAQWAETISATWYLTIQGFLSALVVSQLIFVPGRGLLTIFCNPIMRHLGKISYGLYLWQQLFEANPNSHWGVVQHFPLDVIVPFLIAEVSYAWIENPFLRMKDKLHQKPAPVALAPSVQSPSGMLE